MPTHKITVTLYYTKIPILNYLAHFYFDKIENNHAHNVGLFLPDLVRSFNKSSRVSPDEHRGIITNIDENAMNEACARHIDMDKMFHASDFFNAQEEGVKVLLKAEGFDETYHRWWFVAHVLLEMMLDKVIIGKDDSVLPSFYHSINKVDRDLMVNYLKRNEVINAEEFPVWFNRFEEAKYFYNYIYYEKLCYGLSRICLRAGLKDFTEEQKNMILAAAKSVEENILDDFDNLKREIALKIPA